MMAFSQQGGAVSRAPSLLGSLFSKTKRPSRKARVLTSGALGGGDRIGYTGPQLEPPGPQKSFPGCGGWSARAGDCKLLVSERMRGPLRPGLPAASLSPGSMV